MPHITVTESNLRAADLRTQMAKEAGFSGDGGFRFNNGNVFLYHHTNFRTMSRRWVVACNNKTVSFVKFKDALERAMAVAAVRNW